MHETEVKPECRLARIIWRSQRRYRRHVVTVFRLTRQMSNEKSERRIARRRSRFKRIKPESKTRRNSRSENMKCEKKLDAALRERGINTGVSVTIF